MSLSLLPTVLVAALLGSIPFGLIVAKAWGLTDPRKAGSGNIGATNVLRTGGTAPGLLTLAGDALKGFLAVSAVPALLGAPGKGIPPEAAAAVAVALGHMYSPFAGFRGGKGAATGMGAFAYLLPWPTAFAAAVFGVTVAGTRYVSLGSILGAATVPLGGALARSPLGVTLAAVIVASLIILRHRANIRRLLAGEENKLGQS